MNLEFVSEFALRASNLIYIFMKKIILVEDDTFLSKMYFEKLHHAGNFTVYSVESGQKALSLIQEVVPDLVLLDIILPDMNGIKILQMMKKDSKLKSTPVLMLSNLNEREYINEALSLGAAGYLIKAHFTPNEVVDKIKQLLRANDDSGK